jgi:selenocysteine lyase/cysteine desulfurase
VIYLDNAATSFPKPPAVAESIVDFLEHSAGNPGRSGHALAIAAQTAVDATRSQLAALFGAPDPARIVFALNATDALNMALGDCCGRVTAWSPPASNTTPSLGRFTPWERVASR